MERVLVLFAAFSILVSCTTTPSEDARGAGLDVRAAVERITAIEPPPVASDFQAWADKNQNGLLEREEFLELLEAVNALLQAPHPVRTPPDRYFDVDRNGQLDLDEMYEARILLFREQPRRLTTSEPDQTELFDLNDDGFLNFWELGTIFNFVFPQPWSSHMRQPHDSGGTLDQKIDDNHDNFIDQEEIEAYVIRALIAAAVLPLLQQEEQQFPANRPEVFAYVDLNADGILQPLEMNDLVYMTVELLFAYTAFGPFAENPLDRYFDRNQDRRNDKTEIQRARDQLLKASLESMYEAQPEFTEHYVDLNRNGRVDKDEIEAMYVMLFSDHSLRQPHPVSGPIDERLDLNNNGQVDFPELWPYHNPIAQHAVLNWLDIPAETEERWVVRSILDELSDLDDDGFLNWNENRISMSSLREPHKVRSEFDKRIDFNRNHEVEMAEIIRARRADEVLVAETGAIDSLPVATALDDYLDLNGDKMIDNEEIEKVIRAYLQPEQASFPSRFGQLLDLNHDGTISREEMINSREMYFRAHPVHPGFSMDKELDINRNEFVEPSEIGIAAGVSGDNFLLSFDERLEKAGWEKTRQSGTDAEQMTEAQLPSELYKKLGRIQDHKLAMVNLTCRARNIDEDTVGCIMAFIENAFVNLGKVGVVDRRNIGKILEEYEFQQSDLVDEASVTRIGNLAGADIIVVGSINLIGNRYYLNVKLLSVETAEILGSSISEAEEVTEFYNMANDAVYKLF